MGSLRRAAVLITLMTLLAGACGDGGDDGDNVESTGQSTGQTATKPTLPHNDFVTTLVSAPSTERGLLTKVTATNGEGQTRIIFEFRDGMPGYSIDYTRRPIVQDGSGDEVEVEGDEVLLIRFEPASGFDTEAGKSGQATYTGPKRITVGGNSDPVQELVQVSDFEGQLEWAAGVGGKLLFRALPATDPPSLIVDVKAADSKK